MAGLLDEIPEEHCTYNWHGDELVRGPDGEYVCYDEAELASLAEMILMRTSGRYTLTIAPDKTVSPDEGRGIVVTLDWIGLLDQEEDARCRSDADT